MNITLVDEIRRKCIERKERMERLKKSTMELVASQFFQVIF
jgi:hypothetical protein